MVRLARSRALGDAVGLELFGGVSQVVFDGRETAPSGDLSAANLHARINGDAYVHTLYIREHNPTLMSTDDIERLGGHADMGAWMWFGMRGLGGTWVCRRG